MSADLRMCDDLETRAMIAEAGEELCKQRIADLETTLREARLALNWYRQGCQGHHGNGNARAEKIVAAIDRLLTTET